MLEQVNTGVCISVLQSGRFRSMGKKFFEVDQTALCEDIIVTQGGVRHILDVATFLPSSRIATAYFNSSRYVNMYWAAVPDAIPLLTVVILC